MKEEPIRILKTLPYEVWYWGYNKTVYIYPPVKVKHLKQFQKYFRTTSKYKVDNIIIGRLYENYL